MRRPTPLPPPADASTDAAVTAAERGSAVAVDEDTGAVALPEADRTAVTGEDRPIAPVIPLTSPTPMQRPADLPETAVPLGEPPVEDPPVRIRDVWAAARARRKALRAEVRRFTGRQRRRRLLLLGGAASVLLLVLVTLGAAYSPLFAVEQIRIVGSEKLDTLALEAALKDQLGTPLPLVDESAVKAVLVTFPLVESYTLEARPPHELVVRIVERTPIGLIQTRAGYTLVDAAGVALSTSGTPAPGQPLVTVQGGTDSPAFTAIGLVMRSLPDSIRNQVTAVSASTPDDVTLTLGGANAQVVWGSAEDSAMKALVLEKAMAARPPASVSVYDVSSPRAIVIR
ncbi:cell division protein FtsQ [Microbacterium sp. cf046]|uniref:FtsQ-type POTRA domain-containing protein n=1 Tax=Microbacterium sp. cf046 TaxID=1761803 RepID=UPI0008E03866|nr:FtsQ-type POTRA domain-containing protein [Microbacterium sp. cf046]SFS03160.1 cell division protein FtsQ [Microbacterium sp. cf046]